MLNLGLVKIVNFSLRKNVFNSTFFNFLHRQSLKKFSGKFSLRNLSPL